MRCRVLPIIPFVALLLTLTLSASAAWASAEVRLREANAFLQQEAYDDALEVLHQLEESLPDPARLNGLLAVAYLGRGFQRLAANDPPGAREAFRAGRRYRDDDPRLWQGEAIALLREGRSEEAAYLLDDALGLLAESGELYFLLGQAWYAAGRMAEAVDSLTRAHQLSANDQVAALLDKVRREWRLEAQMDQAYRGRFLLSFVDGDRSSELAAEVLAVLERAYAELGSDLNIYPDVTIPALIYTRAEYADLTGSPDWSGAVYDGKIRLPVAGAERVGPALEALLYHEYMHVLVHLLARGKAPVWLNEGLAEVAGRRVKDRTLVDLAARGRDALLSWETLAGPFNTLAADQVPLAYEQSYALVAFMLERYGWHAMTDLLANLGRLDDWPTAVAAAYRGVGMSWPAILNEWQAELN